MTTTIDRTVFSFENGTYYAKNHQFKKLQTDVIACNHFELPFQYISDCQDWYDLPTPAMQSILDSHFINEPEYQDICCVAYILIGRMLNNNDDDWNVSLLFKGGAKTGKSTFLKNIIGKIYNSKHVGFINNLESSPIGANDKFICIALDIIQEMELSQMTCPIAMASNCYIPQQTVVFSFNNTTKIDSTKFHSEMPMILQKCNLAYKDAISKWSTQNIWNHLPQYFQNK